MRSMKTLLCVSTALILSAPHLAQAMTAFPDLTAAKLAVRSGDFAKAAENWAPLADFGYGEAQLELGNLYAQGKGVTQDYGRAFQLFSQATESGSPRAYMELGQLYENGTGAPQDPAKAEELYRKAVAGGYVRASAMLGRLYEKNPSLSPAAGHMAPQVTYESEDYYMSQIKAGKLGYAEQLAHMYENGLGVAQNKQKALMLFMVAARAGSSNAEARAAALKPKLSLEEYLAAQRQAEDLIVYVRAPGFYDPGLKGVKEAKSPRAQAREAFLKELDKPIDLAAVPPENTEHYKKAAAEYQKAIEGGYFSAARNMGTLYEKGLGVPQDPTTALAYYYLAAKSGLNSAQLSADKLAATLSPEQTAQAKAQAESLFVQYAPKAAEPRKPYRFVGDMKTQFIAEENGDLGTRTDELESSFVADAKLGAFFYPTESITGYVEGRAITVTGQASSNTTEDDDSADSTYGELRQAWVEFDDLFDNPRLSTKIGRQRFSEDRALFWNRDLDAVRFDLNSTLTTGFIAVGQNMDNYRVGDNDEFLGSDENRLRVLGEVSQKVAMNHTVEARFLHEDDHSGAETIGTTVTPEDRDNEDAHLTWLGLRSKGSFDGTEGSFQRLAYHVDGMIVGGEETIVSSTAIAGSDNRSIAGTQDRDVFGWGMDAGIAVATRMPLSPTFTVGYAFGSGDDDASGTGKNHAFRQTDMEGNASRYPDDLSASTARNYGEVLRPELSNIHIAQAGVSFPLLSASDIGLTYFAYWLDEEISGLRSSGITAAVNGTDDFIGQALDLGINIDWDEELGLTAPLLDQSSSRIRLGGFQAGDAYGTAEDEYAFKGTAEFRMRF